MQNALANGSGQAHVVYTTLKERIIDFQLKPNERLTEVQLAAEFSTSRTPVREALLKLEREGWVVNRRHHGYTVRDFSIAEIDDVYEVRIALEWLAVQLACDRMSSMELDRLQDFWSNPVGNASSNPAVMLQYDEDFHESIARSTNNQELLRHLCNIDERIRIIRRIDFTSSHRIETTFREHAAVLELIRTKDAAAAQQAISDHIRASRACVKMLASEGLAQIYLGS
ncbi:MAG TPA: GntR family transcriptional regulator [Chloroflexota bacterium]|nr:GntR family transcriptional regulator [Chloroflexota bacterium]